jgi:hypothetical protein
MLDHDIQIGERPKLNATRPNERIRLQDLLSYQMVYIVTCRETNGHRGTDSWKPTDYETWFPWI